MTSESTVSKAKNKRVQRGFLNIDGRIYPLYEGLNSVGRNSKATVIVKNPSVSQQHALITIVDDKQHFISDLESVNGTLLDKNKLDSMLLYKVANNSVIDFASVKAVYNTVSNPSSSTFQHPYSAGDQTNTQLLNDPIFVAQTQVLDDICLDNNHVEEETIANKDLLNCFEDDFNLSDIPDPPVCEISNFNESITTRPDLTIHELPTQIFELGDENDKKNQVPGASKMDIHDLPTQKIDYDVCMDETQDDIHDMIHNEPTQLVNQTVDDQNESNAEQLKDDLTTDVIEETRLEDSGLETTLKPVNDSNQNGISLAIQKEKESKEGDVDDMQSQLQVQHLRHRTIKPIEDDTEEEATTSGSEIVSTKPKNTNKKPLPELTPEDSESEEICKMKSKRKTLQIVSDGSDSETDIEDAEDLKKAAENNKKVDSSGSDTELDESDVQDQLVKLNQSKSEVNSAEKVEKTIESLKESATNNINESDSDADDFEVNVINKSNNSINSSNNKSNQLDDSDVIPATQGTQNKEYSLSFAPRNNSTLISTSKNAHQTEEQVFDVSQKLKELRKSTAMLAQNCTEESIHFNLSEDHVQNKKSEKQNNDDDDKTPDISDIEDNDDTTKVDESSSKETLNIFELPTQKIIEDPERFFDNVSTDKAVEKDNDKENKKINDVSISNEKDKDEDALFDQPTQIISASSKNQPGDSIFLEPTQILISDEPNIPKGDSIFFEPTQKLIGDEPNSSKNDSIFFQPTQKLIPNDEKEPNSSKCDTGDGRDPSDSIFLEPTQKLILNDEKELNTSDLGDSIFLEPTQKIISNEEKDNANFMQPTTDNSTNQNISDNDEIFKQPTQIFKNKKSGSSKNNSNNVNILPQPIQNEHTNNLKVAVKKSTDNEDDEDLYDQPTQIITTETSVNIFDQPTQKIECDKNTIEFNNAKPTIDCTSLSLNKSKEGRTKLDDVESQLEVMFASQTLKLSMQDNDRPSNPLVNVFDGKSNVDSQDSELLASPQSVQSTESTKEYCAQPTLTVDEHVDVEEETNKKQEKSARKRKANKTTLPEITVAKRSLRNKEKDSTESSAQKSYTSRRKNADEKTNNTVENKAQKLTTSRGKNAVEDTNTVEEKAEDIKVNKKENDNIDDTPKQRRTRRGNASNMENTSSISVSSEEITEDVQLKPKKKPSKINTVDTQDETSKPARSSSRTKLDPASSSNKAKLVSDNKKMNADDTKLETKEESQDVVPRAAARRRGRKQSTTLDNTKTSFLNDVKSKTETTPTNIETKSTRRTRKASTTPTNFSTSPVGSVNETNTPEDTTKPDNSASKNTKRSKKATVSKEPATPVMLEETATRRTRRGETTEKPAAVVDLTPVRVSKRSKRILSREDDEKNKADVADSKKTKQTEVPTKDGSISSNNSDFVTSTPARSKRMLNKDDEKVKPGLSSVKKTKVAETPKKEKASTSSNESNVGATPRSRKELSSLNITADTPERNRRTIKPKVVFTMMNSPELESVIRTLGGMVVDSVNACTVLVTGVLKRSQKLLSAVGQAKPICSPKWLQECKKANKFLDPWDYILEDKDAEKTWKVSLKNALERSKKKKLLEGYTVLLTVTEAVDVLKEAIESSGGKYVTKAPAKNVKTEFFVVGNPNKKASYARFLKQNPPVTVVAPEAIFDGVLRQELRLENHLLS